MPWLEECQHLVMTAQFACTPQYPAGCADHLLSLNVATCFVCLCFAAQLAEEQELEKQAAVQASDRYRWAPCQIAIEAHHHHSFLLLCFCQPHASVPGLQHEVSSPCTSCCQDTAVDVCMQA